VDPLVGAHFMITKTQKHRLRQLAAREDLPMAHFVRRAIDHYLTVAAGPAADQLRHKMVKALGTLPITPSDESDAPAPYF
jgi:hypothetical protein